MAAGVTAPLVRLLITGAEIGTVDGELIPHSEAVKAVHAFRTGRLRGHPSGARPGVFGSALANPPSADPRQRRKSVMVSTGLHATAALLVTMLATAQLTTAADDPDLFDTSRLDRLVFLATPGPGGGGGGGGLRQPMPPPKAEREGPATISSPVPERIEPRKIEPVPEPEPPKPKLLENESLPPVFAPLVPSRADSRDVPGTARGQCRQGGAGAGTNQPGSGCRRRRRPWWLGRHRAGLGLGCRAGNRRRHGWRTVSTRIRYRATASVARGQAALHRGGAASEYRRRRPARNRGARGWPHRLDSCGTKSGPRAR